MLSEDVIVRLFSKQGYYQIKMRCITHNMYARLELFCLGYFIHPTSDSQFEFPFG